VALPPEYVDALEEVIYFFHKKSYPQKKSLNFKLFTIITYFIDSINLYICIVFLFLKASVIIIITNFSALQFL
jgi:hypothetical protein